MSRYSGLVGIAGGLGVSPKPPVWFDKLTTSGGLAPLDTPFHGTFKRSRAQPLDCPVFPMPEGPCPDLASGQGPFYERRKTGEGGSARVKELQVMKPVSRLRDAIMAGNEKAVRNGNWDLRHRPRAYIRLGCIIVEGRGIAYPRARSSVKVKSVQRS